MFHLSFVEQLSCKKNKVNQVFTSVCCHERQYGKTFECISLFNCRALHYFVSPTIFVEHCIVQSYPKPKILLIISPQSSSFTPKLISCPHQVAILCAAEIAECAVKSGSLRLRKDANPVVSLFRLNLVQIRICVRSDSKEFCLENKISEIGFHLRTKEQYAYVTLVANIRECWPWCWLNRETTTFLQPRDRIKTVIVQSWEAILADTPGLQVRYLWITMDPFELLAMSPNVKCSQVQNLKKEAENQLAEKSKSCHRQEQL